MSIRKREWETSKGEKKTAWLVDYRDGQGVRRSKQFATKKAAEAWRITTAYDVTQGVHIADSQSVTVEKAAELWVEAKRAQGREKKTVDGYESTARLHIIPLIGKEKLSSLTRPKVEKFKNDLLNSPERTTARAARAINYLSMMLDYAESIGLVNRNVASKVQVTRSSRDATDVVIPTPEELKKMIDGSEGQLKPLVLTAALAALRASELRGLMWEDIDFEASTISVKRRADEACKLGKPKSKAGTRTIPMSPMLALELKKWKLQCPPTLLDLVFPSPEGKIWTYANLMNRFFWPMQVTAGVSEPLLDKEDGLPVWDKDGGTVMDAKYSLHALRHGAASLWIKEKIDLKRLKAWMGHASIQTTIDTYGHLMFDDVEDAVLMAGAEKRLFG